MDALLGISIVALSALIHASFQLTAGCLILLFYRSFSTKKMRLASGRFVRSFTTGAGLTVFVVLSALCFWLVQAFGWQTPNWLVTIEIGLLVALGVVLLFFYYRRGSKGMELYLPRGLVKFLTEQIKKTTNNQEAFVLGSAAVIAELPFSVILMLISASSIAALPINLRALGVLLHVLLSILPLLIVALAVKKRHTIGDFQRWRIKNKVFLKNLSGLCCFVLAAYLVVFKLIPLLLERV
jgi:hypothetical protein